MDHANQASKTQVASPAAIRRAVVACGIGLVFEIYDFIIYGLMAGLLGRPFFPSADPNTALIKWTGNPLAPSFYVMLAGVASFIATMFITERAGRPLPEDVAEPFLREQIA